MVSGFKWSYMWVIVAPGNCLVFTNRFWENKLPSIPFNMQSLAMQMVPPGHLFGVSLDGRLSSCVTGVTEIGVSLSGFSGIAFLFRLLFKYLKWCSARIFLSRSEILRIFLWGESTIIITLTSFVFTVMLVLLRSLLLFDTLGSSKISFVTSLSTDPCTKRKSSSLPHLLKNNHGFGSTFCSWPKRPIILFSLLYIFFKWSWKYNLVVGNIRRCLCDVTCLLEYNAVWFYFSVLRENMTSWACFIRSLLKHIFQPLNALSLLRYKSSFKIFVEQCTILTIKNSDVSSVN